LGGFVATLGFQLHKGWVVPIDAAWAAFVFQFILIWLIAICTSFWQTMATFAMATQPFVGLNPREGGKASDTLLLDYFGLPPIISIYVAFQKSHYKIVCSSVMALLNRLLPIIVIASVVVAEETKPGGQTVTVIYFNKPWVIATCVFLGSYIFIMPILVLSGERKRHLPRQCLCLADMISWLYDSSLIGNDIFETLREDREPGYLDDRDVIKARLVVQEQQYLFGKVKNESDRKVTYHLSIEVKRHDWQYVEKPPTHWERTKSLWPWSETRKRIRHKRLRSDAAEDDRDVGLAVMSQNVMYPGAVDVEEEHDG
jgi:hypothetical protein